MVCTRLNCNIVVSKVPKLQYVTKIKSAYRACIVGNLRIREKQMRVKAYREKREKESKKKREIRIAGETSGISVLFFSDTFPRYNPVVSFLVHLSSRCTPHPVPDNVLFSRNVYFPAEIRRLSGRKCLERTNESGMRTGKERVRSSQKGRKKKRLQEEMRPKS